MEQRKLNINQPPVKNTPSQLSTQQGQMVDCWLRGSPSKVSRWDFSGRHRHTGSPRWYHRMFTWPHAQQAVHVFGLTWCKWSNAPGSWVPAVPANTGQNKVNSDSSVLGIFSLSFLFTAAVDSLSWGRTSRKEHPQGDAIFQPPSNRFLFVFFLQEQGEIKVQIFLSLELDMLLFCDVTAWLWYNELWSLRISVVGECTSISHSWGNLS